MMFFALFVYVRCVCQGVIDVANRKVVYFFGSFESDLDQILAADFIPCCHFDFITKLCVVKTVVIRCSLFFRYWVTTSLVDLN